tara:strand:+ start:1073 stop:1960 length:888 start_codon:yes stop_codon:yes gene_type:complete
MNFFKKLSKTREKISGRLSEIFSSSEASKFDFEEIEDCLLSSDISWSVTSKLVNSLKENKNSNFIEILKLEIKNILSLNKKFKIKKNIIMIGVNGAGKTTSSAKLANFLKLKNNKVSLVAADTYRAAAVEQLKIWANKINVEFVSNNKTNDPASIAFDGVKSGDAKNNDYVIIDTAGRLHTSENLMNELEKVYRVISKITNDITILINIDANVGQNGIKQVEDFNKFLPIDGIILNKMDGTAKGGVAISIVEKLGIPIVYVGLGEKIENIMSFNIDSYVDSIIDFDSQNKELEIE